MKVSDDCSVTKKLGSDNASSSALDPRHQRDLILRVWIEYTNNLNASMEFCLGLKVSPTSFVMTQESIIKKRLSIHHIIPNLSACPVVCVVCSIRSNKFLAVIGFRGGIFWPYTYHSETAEASFFDLDGYFETDSQVWARNNPTVIVRSLIQIGAVLIESNLTIKDMKKIYRILTV